MTKTRTAALPTLAATLALALAACAPAPETAAEAVVEPAATPPAQGLSSSSAGLPAGDIEAGRKLAANKNAATGQACIDCHGVSGNAPIDPTYPKLGGQYHDYLAHALQLYRNGDRQNALMSAQAKPLSDQQIADLAAYFGSEPSQLRDLRGLE